MLLTISRVFRVDATHRGDWVPQEAGEALAELGDLVELLQRRHEALAGLLEGDFLPLRTSVWSSEANSQAAVQTLSPPLTENLRKVPPHPPCRKPSWCRPGSRETT